LVESPGTVTTGGSVASHTSPNGKINVRVNSAGSSTKSMVKRPAARNPAKSAGQGQVQVLKGKQAASADDASSERSNKPRTANTL
jgi:hypothetical protein